MLTMWSFLYEIIHIWTAVVDESEEWSSQLIFQFKQLERRSLKKSGLQRDSNPWPPRYRCDALPTELWSHTLGARSINWVHIFPWGVKWCEVFFIWNNSYMNCGCRWKYIYEDLASNVWLHSSVGRASHRYRGGHGFESRWSPDFFRLLLSNCLNWKINCDDHSSLSGMLTVTQTLLWMTSRAASSCEQKQNACLL